MFVNQLNVCTTSITEGEVAGVKLVKAPPPPIITDHSKAVVLMWSLLAVWCQSSVMFHFMFVHYTFSSVCVAEWPPFRK